MLTSTFIHVRRLSPKTERSLWDQGALCWSDFLESPKQWVTDGVGVETICNSLETSLKKLEQGEHQYFANRLPRREHWRAFPEFRDSTVYLDIETNGRMSDESVTIVGLYDGVDFKPFIRGENLADLPDALSCYSTIVTFYGGAFDLPVLFRQFPNLMLDQIHIDLCVVLRRLGYRGGLKSIERQFGIERSRETAGLSGRDAVRLWNSYRRRDNADALEMLLQYNREDVVNLERLMEAAYLDLRLLAMG